MSLCVLSVTTLAIAGVSMTLSTTYCNGQQYYQCVQTARIAMKQIQGIINKSKLITASTQNSLLVWVEDTNRDQRINRTEMLSLRYDKQTGEIRTYRVTLPSDLAPETKTAMDTHIPLSDVTSSTMPSWLQMESMLTNQLLASNVTDFGLKVSPTAPLANLAEILIKVTSEARSLTLRSGSFLRGDMTRHVGTAGGQYVLDTEGI